MRTKSSPSDVIRRFHRALPAAVFALVFVSDGVGFAAKKKTAIIQVTNLTDQSRIEEILELQLTEVKARLGNVDYKKLQVEEATRHIPLPVQLDGSSDGNPDRLLVLVSLAPHQTKRLSIQPARQTVSVKPLVFGRVVPERKDDFAWENDKVAYRVYGPALEATGEITSGIDVWSKRVPDLIIDQWYARDAEGQRTHNPLLSYHKDTGQGLDSYDVGPTRGCGGSGVWTDGHLFVSKNYVRATVLANGPLRLRFKVEYAPWQVAGAEVTETKVITLDAGSHMNRIDSTLSWKSDDTKSRVAAAGLATHTGSHVTPSAEEGMLAVWEPLTDSAAGMEGAGIVNEPGKTGRISLTGSNALLLNPAANGVPTTYYAGAGWSKADMPDEAAWIAYLHAFRERLLHPLTVRWE
jgi:hypothetical protein